MPDHLTKESPRWWPCGTCRAESGTICRTATGNPCPSHVDRYRSVALWQRYGRTPAQLWADAMAGAR